MTEEFEKWMRENLDDYELGKLNKAAFDLSYYRSRWLNYQYTTDGHRFVPSYEQLAAVAGKLLERTPISKEDA